MQANNNLDDLWKKYCIVCACMK